MTAIATPIAEQALAESLQQRLLEFVAHLRSNGFIIGVAETIDAQRVARHCDITQGRCLHWGLRSLFCSGHEQWQQFDELFDGYWRMSNRRVHSQLVAGAKQLATSGTDRTKKSQQTDRSSADADSDQQGADEGEAGQDGVQKGASQKQGLMQVDFRFINDARQMRAVEQLAERLALKIKRRLIRRQKIHHHGHRIHLRRTIRQSLRYGGMPLQLVFSKRWHRPLRLILIADVSRSMSMYSYVFLRFARGLIHAFRDAEAFAYHTHLVPITEALSHPDLDRVRQNLEIISTGWSGGTRIGECLEDFNKNYSRLLSSRSLVIIVSDGLDTGSPEALVQQLENIKRRCRNIVWLNPLLGRAGYEVQTGSMLAALPLIDIFAPAHNLDSLLALEDILCQQL